VADVTSDDTLELLQQQFVEAVDTTNDARAEAELHRQYYDGVQWTASELAVLRARNQAPIVDNRIKDKVEHLLGLERKTRTDPKAFPRNPTDEKAAEAATDALRYVSDLNDFPQLRSFVAENMLIEGYGGCEVIVEKREGKNPKVVQRKIRWDRLYFDPFSMEADFSDANYMGIVTWLDSAVAKQRWPKSADLITESMTNAANAETFDDRPRWVDTNRKRVQVFETYYRQLGKWMRAVWFKGGFLEKPTVSSYVDQDGEPQCPIIAQSLYVGQDGDRYGVVRRYKTLQDEINHRRSKALHIFNSRQTIAEKGAVDDPQTARREVAKADGYIEVNPGMRFDVGVAADMAQGQFQLLADAYNSMGLTGPNEALQGTSGNISGRAKQLDQEGGAIQLGVFFDSVRYFQRRVMRATWNRIQQYWDQEEWIRVRDEEGRMQFVALNQPTTQGELEAEKLAGQMMPEEQKLQMIEQIAMNPQARTPTIKNAVGQLDVDIVIDESPDTVTLQAEQFKELANLAQAGVVFPPDVYLEASSLRNKDKLLDKLRGNDPQSQAQAQAQQEAAALAKAQAEANVRKTNAQANKDEVSAAVDMTEAAKRLVTPQPAPEPQQLQ
jgi:hypothetical protein